MRKINKIGYYAISFVFVLFTLLPILYGLTLFFSNEGTILATRDIIPKNFTLNNLVEIVSGSRSTRIIFIGLRNSLTTASIVILMSLFVSLPAAFVLVNYEFKSKKLITNLLLSTMVIPVLTTIIPLFLLYANWGLLDNHFSLALVYLSSFLPTSVWLSMNYFKKVPKSLLEASRIDGASDLMTFFKVYLPISIPNIISVVIINFLMSFSQYQVPLILASSVNTKPISIVVGEFVSKDAVFYGLTIGSGLVTLIIPVILVIIFRKYLIEGILSFE